MINIDKSVINNIYVRTHYQHSFEYINDIAFADISDFIFNETTVNLHDDFFNDFNFFNSNNLNFFSSFSFDIIKDYALILAQAWNKDNNIDNTDLIRDISNIFNKYEKHLRKIEKALPYMKYYYLSKNLDIDIETLIKNHDIDIFDNNQLLESYNILVEKIPHEIFKYFSKKFKNYKTLACDFINNEYEILDDILKHRIKFKRSKKYSEVFIFKDNSLAFEKDCKFEIVISNIEHKDFLKNIYFEINKEINFKNPNMLVLMENTLKSGISIDVVHNINFYIHTLKNVIKNEELNINSFINKIDNSISYPELLEDKLRDLNIKNNIKNLKKVVINSGNRIVFDDPEIEKFFKILIEKKVSKSDFREAFGKNIAKYKTVDILKEAFIKYTNDLYDFNKEYILKKIKNKNAVLLGENNNRLYIKVNDFEVSETIGSVSWCISTSKSYFDEIIEDKSSQYFVFDFNLES